MKYNIFNIRLLFILFSIVLFVVFLFGSLIPYIQMNKYRSLIVSGGSFVDVLYQDGLFFPYTDVSNMVCTEIISRVTVPITKTLKEITSTDTQTYVPFLENIVLRCDPILRDSTDPVDRFLLATIYDYLGHMTNDKKYTDVSNTLIEGVLRQSPERQTFQEFVAVHHLFERNFVEAKKEFTLILKEHPQSRQASYYLNMLQGYGVK